MNSSSVNGVLRVCVVGTQHVRKRSEKDTPTIRVQEKGATVFGRLQHLVSERWNESQDNRQRSVWAELQEDSSGSRHLTTAGCAVQEKEDKRRWRPAQEQRTDGRKDFTCAVCVFVEKRARKRENRVAVAGCSTLCSVVNVEDAGEE